MSQQGPKLNVKWFLEHSRKKKPLTFSFTEMNISDAGNEFILSETYFSCVWGIKKYKKLLHAKNKYILVPWTDPGCQKHGL